MLCPIQNSEVAENISRALREISEPCPVETYRIRDGTQITKEATLRVLLFFPRRYSLDKIIREGFEHFHCQAKTIDFYDFFPEWQNYLINKGSGIPRKIQKHWFDPYLKKINKEYLRIAKDEEPDLIIVYNDQYLLPETAREIKRLCAVFSYLGDNPLYVQRRPFNVATAVEMNYVFAPDSFWVEQLKQIGLERISTLYFGYNRHLNYSVVPTADDLQKYACDLLMVGGTYSSSFGYKRALFYSQFSDLDIRIYGAGWDIWLDYFPNLRSKLYHIDKPLSFETVNLLCSCSKIYPVDANPGLIHGVHVRVFDTIGSGILPLVEYRRDIDTVFNGVEIPLIRNYRSAKDIAEYYLRNDKERKETVDHLKSYLDNNITPAHAAGKILEVYESLSEHGTSPVGVGSKTVGR